VPFCRLCMLLHLARSAWMLLLLQQAEPASLLLQ
jgi:hypothetical protein